MKSIKSIRNRRFQHLETLENRVLLDGDVSVSLLAGDLIVRGDSEDNQLVISRPASGTIRIAGVEETTVNGEEFFDLTSSFDDLKIQMQQGGEDQVAIQGPMRLPGDVQARLGAGEFVVEGSNGPLKISGDLIVRTGEEGNATIRNQVKVEGETSINAGGDVSVVSGRATLPDFAAAEFDDSLNIDNPYFPAVPGAKYTYVAEGIDDETGEPFTEEIVVEVLPETRTILGVEVRVVRDRVFSEGLLIEDTFDWYAQDNNGNVWYFGEDTTEFEYDDEGNVISSTQEGSWEAGIDGSHAGIIMEAQPRVGHRYYQEFSPNNVLDHGEGLALGETATVDVGTYTDVFRTEEASVMEPLGLANKLYAPGVGTIVEFDIDLEDDEVLQTTRLVSLTLNGQEVTELVPTDGFDGVNATGRYVGGITLKKDAELSSKGAVVVNGAKFRDDLHIRAGEELIVVDSKLRKNALLSTNDTVSLRGVFARETIKVKGGPDDIHIFESDISRFKAKFGRSDDLLSVRNSTFDVLRADGGGGENTFEDLGGNTFGKLRLRRFA